MRYEERKPDRSREWVRTELGLLDEDSHLPPVKSGFRIGNGDLRETNVEKISNSVLGCGYVWWEVGGYL